MPLPPFTPRTTPDYHFPTTPADVDIRFEGLLLLIPSPRGDRGTNCIVGALQAQVPPHILKIEITDNGTLAEVPSGTGRPITFPVKIWSGDAGVMKYVSTPVAMQFPGTEDPSLDNVNDFRWSVDLRAFHGNARPATNTSRLQVAATLTDGLLYTADRTDPERMAVHLVNPAVATPKDLNRIASEVGVYVKLAASQTLNLSWTDVQGPQTLRLAAGGGSGQGYTIRITNLPTNVTQHDDFEAYYTHGIDTTDRHFKMRFFKEIGLDASENVDAPCMPAGLDGDGRSGS